MAIAHKILKIAYKLLSSNEQYKDLGDAYLDQLDQKRVAENLVRRLERLGYEVTLTKTAATASPAPEASVV